MTEQDLIDMLKVAVRKETVGYFQMVDRPWRVLGTLALSMGQFFVLWTTFRMAIYLRRLSRTKVAETEKELTWRPKLQRT